MYVHVCVYVVGCMCGGGVCVWYVESVSEKEIKETSDGLNAAEEEVQKSKEVLASKKKLLAWFDFMVSRATNHPFANLILSNKEIIFDLEKDLLLSKPTLMSDKIRALEEPTTSKLDPKLIAALQV